MESVKILQVVGYKNSGKTTLITNWIKRATKAGKKVATLKSHGHGGPIDLPSEHTDSMRFLTSGATSSSVISPNLAQIHFRRGELNIEKLIELTIFAVKPNLILIEGFKEEHYEKVVLVNRSEDWEQLRLLTNIRCVVSKKKIEHPAWCKLNETDHWFDNWIGED